MRAALAALCLSFILLLSFSGCAQQQASPAQNKTGDLIANKPVPAAQKVAEKGDTVSVNYIGKLQDGTVFDTSIREEAQKAGFQLRPSYSPLSFKVGAGQMIAGFDAGVVGMKEGEEKIVTLPPEQAYGNVNPDAIFSIPLANIGNSGQIKVGSVLTAQNGASGKVVEINGTDAKVDFNHELAGQTLIFTIRMVSITKR